MLSGKSIVVWTAMIHRAEVAGMQNEFTRYEQGMMKGIAKSWSIVDACTKNRLAHGQKLPVVHHRISCPDYV